MVQGGRRTQHARIPTYRSSFLQAGGFPTASACHSPYLECLGNAGNRGNSAFANRRCRLLVCGSTRFGAYANCIHRNERGASTMSAAERPYKRAARANKTVLRIAGGFDGTPVEDSAAATVNRGTGTA